MEVLRLDAVGERQWTELIGAEREPWGGGIAERFSWAAKTDNVGIRERDGRLLAVAGSVRAHVQVADGDPFEVLGIGGVFVARDARGRGFVTPLLDALLARADASAGPERAMLFCREALVAMYRKFDFREIADPAWAEQPGGRERVPLSAMWRPLRAGATWPAGRVDVLGLPF